VLENNSLASLFPFPFPFPGLIFFSQETNKGTRKRKIYEDFEGEFVN
jgi:hypothetical protein